MDSLTTFRWWRRGEPEWVKAPAAGQQLKQWWLVEGQASDPYQPLRDALALFRTFADISEHNRDAVADFVREYGSLVVGAQQLAGTDGRAGEPWALWRREIGAMRRAIELWEARPDELAKWIRFDDDRCWVDLGDAAAVETIATPDHHPELWVLLAGRMPKQRRLRRAALFYVQGQANDRLKEHTAARLLFDPDSDQERVHVLPRNLLGALWLQLARAVEGDKEYRRCEECQRWFEVSPEGMRPESKYCGTACRMRAYRRRKAKGR
jgi:hypothetical protein